MSKRIGRSARSKGTKRRGLATPRAWVGVAATLAVIPASPLHADPLVPLFAPSRVGLTGMVRLPNADVTPDGEASLTGFSAFAPVPNGRVGDAAAYSFNLGLLPQLELGAQLNDPAGREDLSGAIKIQLLPENSDRPAIAVGAVGLSSIIYPRSEFVAISKVIMDGRLNATAGYMSHSPGVKHGVYGGLELAVIPHVTGVAEYDGKDLNVGARAGFFRDHARIGVSHLSRGWAFQAGVHVSLGSGNRPPAAVTLAATPLDTGPALTEVQNRLVRAGLENVTTGTPAPGVIAVGYENRSFPHNEMTALAYVLAVTAHYAPTDVTTARVTVIRDSLPVLTIQAPLAGYRDFLAGKLNNARFRQSMSVAYTQAPATRGAANLTPLRAPTPGHVDLLVQPGATTHIGSEDYILGVALNVTPELSAPLGHGLLADGSVLVPLGDAFGFRSHFGLRPEVIGSTNPHLEQLSLHWTWHPSPLIVSRVFGGRFTGNRVGPFAQVALLPGSSRLKLEAEGGVLKRVGLNTQQGTAVGIASYYFPTLDMEAIGTAGQYIDGDTGGTIGILRHFGNTDVGASFLSSSHGNAVQLTFGIPIGPDHLSNRPSLLRLRPSELFEHDERTLVSPHGNPIAKALSIGNRLPLNDSLDSTWLDRDHLTPQYILNSLALLRQIPASLRSHP